MNQLNTLSDRVEYYDIEHIFINRNDVATCQVRIIVTQRQLPSGAAMKENAQSSARRPHEVAWEKGFAALKEFKSREGHCRVPRGHEEGSFRLGKWVSRQRNKKNTLSTDRRRRLDAIGFVWDPYEVEWEKNFATLKQFKSREGHCRVPRGHEEGNFKLGTWVVNQRNRRNNLSVERKQRLKAISFVWRLK